VYFFLSKILARHTFRSDKYFAITLDIRAESYVGHHAKTAVLRFRPKLKRQKQILAEFPS
jgi:hypothetical protein